MRQLFSFSALFVSLLLLIACNTKKEVDYASGQVIKPDLSTFYGAEPYLPDIETFMQIGYGGSPDISPDGIRVFFTSNITGVSQLFRLDNGWPYQLTVFPEGINWYTFSHSADLAIVGVDVGGSENSQLLLLDTHSGRVKQLTNQANARFGGVFWSPDDKTIYFYSNMENLKDFKLYKMDVATAVIAKLLDIEGFNGWAAQSLDGSKLLYYTASSNVNTDLFIYDVASGDIEHLTPHEGDVQYNNTFFSADGKSLYLTCDDNSKGMNFLAKMDLDSKKISYLEENATWDVENVNMTIDRKIMGWIINENGYGRLKLRNLETGKDLPVPKLDGICQSPAFSKSTRMLFSFTSPTQTTDIWSWDWSKQKLQQLTFSTYAGIDRSMFTEPQLITYESFDGMEIPAFLYLPPGYQKGQPIPFILDMHGGPEGQFRPYFSRHFQYLMLHGFGFLAPNVRGSEGYGKDYLAMDNYKKRLASVKDMKAGADWLIEQGYSAQGMLGVKGGSYGGYMSMAAVTEYPGFFSAAINEVGIVNFVTFLQNTASYRRALRESEYGPLTDQEFLKSISPIHKADLITTPMLIVHGENDPRVPVGEARQIIKAIQKNGGVVDSLIFDDEGHGISKRKNSLIVYRKMADFFESHLKK